MIDKIMDNVWWIIVIILFVFVAGSFYNLGLESRTNKLCKQLGGVYVQTWSDGHACIHATEVPLK
jgi:hypothetical protein